MKSNRHFLRFASISVMFLAFLPTSSVTAKNFTEVSLMAGYRQDTLDWNIRDYTGPNILSELTWRDMKMFQLRGDVLSISPRGFYFRGSANYGWVRSGENQDSDYAGDDRTLEFSRSINGVKGSKVKDFKAGFGIVRPFGARSQHRFAPLMGYAYHSQDFRMKDGEQVVSNSAYYDLINPDPNYDVLPPGPFPGLNSSYESTWTGAWIGADFIFNLEASGTTTLRLEHHWPDYSAKANWNLRPVFAHPVSFRHKANGRGFVVELAWESVPFQRDWQWGINLSWKNWKTQSGVDRTYYYDGSSYAAILNEVNWTSSQINISVNKEIGTGSF